MRGRDRDLYGTTWKGGSSNQGNVFEVAAETHALSSLVSFTGNNGIAPNGSLVMDGSGNLLGTTYEGGTAGFGTVFEVAAVAHAISGLFTFNSSNGQYPAAGLTMDGSGTMYGTVAGGGANADGLLVKVASGTHAVSTLATLGDSIGWFPNSRLVEDTGGNFFGTTLGGGASLDGTIFKAASGTHALSVVATFNGANGAQPKGALVEDAAGNLYGTTTQGGGHGLGCAFEWVAATHTLTPLVSFDGATIGSDPEVGLTMDSQGNLFGATWDGGPGGFGTVFELAADTHVFSTLVAFNDVNGRGRRGS